ncbi:hypothetical protein [Desulfocucumis palustris]|uniref:hypothetical protein n=1 Tax=Desulfocucumis palustris TaxID=1898651 RepID=UPI000CEA026E|nr:hypothetical protein [Desulfocucumis palustris]
MALQKISEGIPDELQSQLMPQEDVYYFSYISFEGGCLSSSPGRNYWISITNKRVLYKAKVNDFNNNAQVTVEKDGILPIEKISFLEVSDMKKASGCSSVQVYELKISTSGGTVIIPIPTKEKGYEIRKIFSQIVEELKPQGN